MPSRRMEFILVKHRSFCLHWLDSAQLVHYVRDVWGVGFLAFSPSSATIFMLPWVDDEQNEDSLWTHHVACASTVPEFADLLRRKCG